MSVTSRTTSKLQAARRGLAAYRKDQDGGMIIFSLFIFVLILWFGGMAVDYMRFETTRAKLQATLDRAVLAAADLDQTLPAEDVVYDYFEKAGMLDFLDGAPIVDEGLNYRIVTANASAEMPMLFADLPRVFTQPFSPGLSTLTVSGTSTAEERVTNVEVSLVLDVSSSMQDNNRFTNLVPAAHDFIDSVMANNGNDTDGLISMSLIAYSAVVNPGEDIAARFAMTDEHDESSCFLIPDAEFDNTDLPFTNNGGDYTRVSHFDYGAETNWRTNPITNWDGRPWCFRPGENEIMVHNTNITQMKQWVSNLTSFGNTAIDLGVKWGVALLDPEFDVIVNDSISRGDSPSIVSGRPLDFDEEDSLKVLVVMSDGANTTEFDLKEPYKTGTSTIWFHMDNDDDELWEVHWRRISIQIAGENTATPDDDRFFHNGFDYNDSSTDYSDRDWSRWQGFHKHPVGFTNTQDYRNAMTGGNGNSCNSNGEGNGLSYCSGSGGQNVINADWQAIFAGWVRTRIYQSFFRNPYNWGAIDYDTYVATYYSMDPVVNGTQADERLSNICEAARDEGVVIYTVAFEAPSGGQAALLDCASSPSHYFDVAGTNITSAFSSIASDIRALKLTQ